MALMTAAVLPDSGSDSHSDLANGCTGPWPVEARGRSSCNFGTDNSNAHVRPDGAHPDHGMPEAFVSQQTKGPAMTLIGWAADGVPIYARCSGSTGTDAGSAVRVMTGSDRLKATPAGQPPRFTPWARPRKTVRTGAATATWTGATAAMAGRPSSRTATTLTAPPTPARTCSAASKASGET